MSADALFPRRWTQYGLNVLGGRRIRGDAAVYFMDGESLEDIIDFWNLRATGRPVLPLPKQFNSTPQFERLITDYLKEHRVHWRHDPKVCEMAHFIRSRHSTMDEMQAYAKTLKLEIPKGDTSTDGFFALQHWYPRIWDEWARDKDDAVPRDTYAEPEASIDIEDPKELVLDGQRGDAVLDRLNELPNLALDTGELRTAVRQARAVLHPQAIQLADVLSAEVLEEVPPHQLVAQRHQHAFFHLLAADGQAIGARASRASPEAGQTVAPVHDVPTAARGALRET